MANGAVTGDAAESGVWFHGGRYRPRNHTGIQCYWQTRPLLEYVLRTRVQALPNVTIHYQVKVLGLSFSDAGLVTGVRLGDPSSSGDWSGGVDLVVDASGRSSKLNSWLVDAGYPAVERTEIGVELMYRTCMFHPPKDRPFDWSFLILYPQTPDKRRAGYIFRVEDDLWLVSMLGYLGVKPPADVEGFVDFAKQLPRPDIYEALQGATPASEVSSYRFTPAFWNNYERHSRLPDGVVAVRSATDGTFYTRPEPGAPAFAPKAQRFKRQPAVWRCRRT